MSQTTKPAPFPWPYGPLPQRYWRNFDRYVTRGGSIRPEEFVKGFVSDPGGKRGDMARFYFFCCAFDQIIKEGVPGDLAELGVYKGHTAAVLAEFGRRTDRQIYLLDTFAGFDRSDLSGVDAKRAVLFTDATIDVVKRRVGEDACIHYVKGHFPDSATKLPADARYALAHIDCDLHAPIKAGLEYFYPRMAPGGFIIVHDYMSLHWDGAEQAVDEFFSDKPERLIPLTDSASSVVVRKI